MKISKIDATRYQIYKAKMHQILFPLGLRPRPRRTSLQLSPRPLVVFSNGREGVKGEEWKGTVREM